MPNDSKCVNPRCCRGHRHPQENDPNFVFACRNCTTQITRQNVMPNGGCRMCGPCSETMRRCGHCGRPFGTV